MILQKMQLAAMIVYAEVVTIDLGGCVSKDGRRPGGVGQRGAVAEAAEGKTDFIASLPSKTFCNRHTFNLSFCMDGNAGPAHIADDFKIKGAPNRLKQSKQDPCIICLEPITERAVAVPCNHLAFDFICLLSWIQEIPKCPLCKTDVTEVQYEFQGPNDFKTYRVPTQQSLKRNTNATTRRNDRAANAPLVQIDPSLRTRRQVYRESLYSLHIGSNRHSGYQEITPASFSSSLDLQSRCRAFLRRELQVFAFLDQGPSPRGGSRAYLIEYIVAILKTNDPKDANGHAVDLVADFLGRENAALLLHELMAWLRSPYARLGEWDAQVQYVESTAGKSETAS